jgi:tRNA wybutosine-synthesizing protein 2
MASLTAAEMSDHPQERLRQNQDSANNSQSTGESSTRPLRYNKKDGKKKKEKKDSPMNPLQHGIQKFLHDHNPNDTDISGLPKRYTIYQPMLLLSANVFTASPEWVERYASLSETDRQKLYASIVNAFNDKGQSITHIAMNAPIQLTNSQGSENLMRSPNGLVPLYGDFGQLLDYEHDPTRQDLENAFWVHTVQNGGITQYWAPLYTMFSKGNITEKARILGLEGHFTGLDKSSLKGARIEDVSVVDLYAGIGYFVFSYLKRGVRRVWGWELNAWSVEGLRRGCVENGWLCKVVPLVQGEDGTMPSVLDDASLEILLNELTDDIRVVIFQGDNQSAPGIMDRIQPKLEKRGQWAAVRHVNMGLLPSSRPTWDTSLKLLDRKYGGWTHVHENVDVAEIGSMRDDIVDEYVNLAGQLDGVDQKTLSIGCDHVEEVKTYAPGVMHCVFDIQVDFEKR